ncbi:hypothetical protein OHB54_28785 [Streptomyces sp. NBC_01007]|nr:hypothetical protein OHB54_28785 [Streptomyces sp. NBC_01007]
MRRRTSLAVAGVVSLAVATAVTTGALLSGAGATAGGAGRSDVLLGHGSSHLPSRTAKDWVSYADHVVVVSALSDQEIAPTQAELERGEGVIGRNVTLKVDTVLWSRAEPAAPAPQYWQYSATGWQFSGGDTAHRRKLAAGDQPRVEIGHSYIMALRWEPAKCAEGDAPEVAQWRGLGDASEIPYDNGVIGNGELEGRTRTTAQARAAASKELAADAPASLEDSMAGRGASALVTELKAAQPLAAQNLVASARSAQSAQTADCG